MLAERLKIVIKIACLVYLIIILPRFFGNFERTTGKEYAESFKFGVQHFVESSDYAKFKTCEFGLIMSDDPCDSDYNRPVDLLVQHGWKVKALLQLPASFYKQTNREGSAPTENMPHRIVVDAIEGDAWNKCLNAVDAVMVDIQPTGMRWDHVALNLLTIFHDAAEQQKPVLILDRPNPLGGRMEGAGSIPYRYGLSLGELAIYVNKYLVSKPADVTVVPLQGWNRFKTIKDHVLLDWQVLGHYYAHALLKPFYAMDPFTVIEEKSHALLLPEASGLTEWEMKYVMQLCLKLGVVIQPYLLEQAGGDELLKGIRFQRFKKIDRLSLLSTFLTLVRFFSNRKTLTIEYSDQFDDVVGTDGIQKFFQGKENFDVLKKNVEQELFAFYEKAKECFLYTPHPTLSALYLRKGLREQL